MFFTFLFFPLFPLTHYSLFNTPRMTSSVLTVPQPTHKPTTLGKRRTPHTPVDDQEEIKTKIRKSSEYANADVKTVGSSPASIITDKIRNLIRSKQAKYQDIEDFYDLFHYMLDKPLRPVTNDQDRLEVMETLMDLIPDKRQLWNVGIIQEWMLESKTVFDAYFDRFSALLLSHNQELATPLKIDWSKCHLGVQRLTRAFQQDWFFQWAAGGSNIQHTITLFLSMMDSVLATYSDLIRATIDIPYSSFFKLDDQVSTALIHSGRLDRFTTRVAQEQVRNVAFRHLFQQTSNKHREAALYFLTPLGPEFIDALHQFCSLLYQEGFGEFKGRVYLHGPRVPELFTRLSRFLAHRIVSQHQEQHNNNNNTNLQDIAASVLSCYSSVEMRDQVHKEMYNEMISLHLDVLPEDLIHSLILPLVVDV